MSVAPSPAPSAVVVDLRHRVTGRVIEPTDDDYDRARTVFYNVARRPAGIVRAADVGDVAKVVAAARETGVALAVRAGGHSIAGHSTVDDGLVLDLSHLDALDIDPDGRTAWAGPGLTAAAYTTAAAEHGLGTGFGDAGSVAISGITLGGGVGYLSRAYGLTIDSLLAADVVTADGDVLRADASTHPELFWALRGGGGNFGVVTRVHLRLHDVANVVGGMLALPATPEVVAGFVAAAQEAPERLSAIANVMTAPPLPFVPAELHGQLVVLAVLVHVGPIAEGEAAMAPFRALAAPLLDQLGPMPYPSVYPPEPEGLHPTAEGRNLFRDTFGRDQAEFIIEHLRAGTAPMTAVQLRALGGAVSRVPDDATAYAHRAHPLMVNVATMFERPEDRDEHLAWVEDGAAGLHEPGVDGVYVNFLGDEGPSRVRAAYPGATWDRLVEVKRRYDAANVFRRNHNIPPD